jgi:hypothetical protein
MEWSNSLDRFRQIPANECDACMEKDHELAAPAYYSRTDFRRGGFLETDVSEEEQLSGKAG